MRWCEARPLDVTRANLMVAQWATHTMLPACLTPVRLSRPSPMSYHARPGFTVVEVLVSLVLVSVGLLAIAGASALALRTATAASFERLAVRQADRRLARLMAAGCTSAGAGTDSSASIRERWSIADSLGGVAAVESSVEWQAGARRRVLTLRSALVC